jgi:hypothetical protein
MSLKHFTDGFVEFTTEVSDRTCEVSKTLRRRKNQPCFPTWNRSKHRPIYHHSWHHQHARSIFYILEEAKDPGYKKSYPLNRPGNMPLTERRTLDDIIQEGETGGAPLSPSLIFA